MAKDLHSEMIEYLGGGKKRLMEITNHYRGISLSTTTEVVKMLFTMTDRGEVVKTRENGAYYYELANPPKSP